MILAGRVVLITGGAKRIGRALTLGLARRGAAIAFSYRSSAPEARRTVRELETLGVRAAAIRADLSRASDIRRLIHEVGRRFGRLDILINCAANFDRVPFERLTERAWDRAIDTNLKGPFLCALHASRLMRARGGKIINLADWAGVRPYRDYLPYCVSKGGLITLTKALAKELAPKIQVNAIAPGPILPPQDMGAATQKRVANRALLKRWGSPTDIVNAALFLIEGTDFATGSVVYVDGGQLIA
jgi:NAD(P)-dependent dehydrogenase (short-subunit alcohol dehydrogenase family)